MITNADGEEKQDCELNAAKRWLEKHAAEYKLLKPTLLGDDVDIIYRNTHTSHFADKF